MDQESPASVLVVDDDLDACQNLADILGDLGYRVATADNGSAALNLVRKTRFDLALLDLKMPGMNGLELYREIKHLRPELVAIIISAYAGVETAREATEAGAWKVLAKPVDLSRLLPLLDEAVQQPLVLVVDDDPDLCLNLWELFRDHGLRVRIAHDQQQTAQALQDSRHRVVLIDMKLPHGDGSGVFSLVRTHDPHARVVLITGFRLELEQLVQQVLAKGADAICYKPFDVRELLATVERLAHADLSRK
jgi:DNA-binding NtrC family response regulator